MTQPLNSPQSSGPVAIPINPQELVYELDSIASVASPIGCNETDWYRYVIKLGGSEIVGHRRGNDAGVRSAVELIVTQLNSRLSVKAARAPKSKR